MAVSQKLLSEPISDSEFHRLLTIYRQRTDPSRRAPERIDRPIIIQPSMAGGRIVNWSEYLDAVSQGTANFPPRGGSVRE